MNVSPMPAAERTEWIKVWWPAVCVRVQRPVAGVRLEPDIVGRIAREVMLSFFEAFPEGPDSKEAALHWLASRAAPRALVWLAAERQRTGQPEVGRDPDGTWWEKNPDFDDLRRRTADGALTSKAWGETSVILRRRALPALARAGVSEDDAEDVFMEALAELTQARSDGTGPLEKMTVFEELPRFFATMAERRGISWQRKLSARKRQATNPALAEPLDAPDSPILRTLADPRVGGTASASAPWANATFDRIFAASRAVLSKFEWHLVVALFVEGTHTRLDLAEDPWVLGELGVTPADSESKRRRRLNLFVEEALAKLGRHLETCDL